VPHRIVVTPEARDHIDQLYRYVATAAQDADIALRFTGGLLDHLATLAEFPQRGTPREDIRPGLRTIPWKRRATIAYVVEELDKIIVGVFYAGRDMEGLLREE
jgi:toxin ParE1/3/4